MSSQDSIGLNTDGLNRTVFISDNLPFLKALDSESVDLVIIDPPFGKQQTFMGNLKPPLNDDERRIERELMDGWGIYDPATAYEIGLEYPDQAGVTANFGDIWNFRQRIYQEWMEQLERICAPAWWLIQSTRYSHGDGHAAYIAFMVERMLEIKRILKRTGSVYLHCDNEANAYLRQMMDAVFGGNNFTNEIVWKRTARGFKGSQFQPRSFNVNADTILFYKKSDNAFFDMSRVLEPYDPNYLEKAFKFEDEKGRYYLDVAYNRPSASPRPNLCYEYKGFYPPHPSGWKTGKARMEELDKAGELVIQNDRLYRKVRPKDGTIRNSIWDDIGEVKGRESTSYPTQKPQELAKRMIEASSNPGDLVLDCFAGCAYVPIAAELAGRRWIACDMSPRAWTMVRRQFHKQPDLRIITEGEYPEPTGGVQSDLSTGRIIRVRGPYDLPERTNEDAPIAMSINTLPEPQYRQKPVENSQQIWDAFVAEWGTGCWYCGMAKQNDRRELQLDHVEPNARDGSNDDCWNRALACVACNGDKSDRLTVEDTIQLALDAGRIATESLRDEQVANFKRRHNWAKERWETVRPQRLPI